MSDLSSICAIEDDSFPSPYPRGLLQRLLLYCRDSFLVAADGDGKLVGYCVCSVDGESAHLISIAVQASHRRKGFATALLKRLATQLADKGVNELRLEVGVTNGEAVALYSKNGFEKAEIIPNYYSDGSDAFRMKLIVHDETDQFSMSDGGNLS